MEPGSHKIITKAEFCVKLGISPMTRHRLLNVRYFEQLKILGYRKTDRYLKVNVLKFLFTELCYTEETE